MAALPHLVTPRLVIRMASYCDIAAIAHYYRSNRTYLQSFEPLRSDAFFSELFWQIQVEQNQQDFHTDQALKLFVFRAAGLEPSQHSLPSDEDPEVVGVVNFSQFLRNPLYRCCLGYSLGQPYQGQGLMQEALSAVIPWVFEHLQFHRIEASYMPRNQRSGNLLRRLGFQVEGYVRDYLLINGQWEDHICTGLINPSWSPTLSRHQPQA